MFITENHTYIFDDPFQYNYLDTMYNGRCQLLESNLDMSEETYIKLTADESGLNGTPIWLFLYYPGKAVSL